MKYHELTNSSNTLHAQTLKQWPHLWNNIHFTDTIYKTEQDKCHRKASTGVSATDASQDEYEIGQKSFNILV